MRIPPGGRRCLPQSMERFIAAVAPRVQQMHRCAEQRLSGFATVGKLTGAARKAERALLIAACASLYERMFLEENPCSYLALPEEYPLFHLLSPWHQIELIRQVVVGLVDSRAPLAPDTPEHHSCLLSLYTYAISQLEIEVDSESIMDPVVNENASPSVRKSSRPFFDKEFAEECAMSVVWESKAHKKLLRAQSDDELESAAAAAGTPMTAPRDVGGRRGNADKTMEQCLEVDVRKQVARCMCQCI